MSRNGQDNPTAREVVAQSGQTGELPVPGASRDSWPPRPQEFRELLTPVEAAQYLRLDETGAHTPQSAARTLNYWRDRGELKATRFARRV